MYVWCELVCDECARTTAGQYTTGAIPRREMKREAASFGWLFKDHATLCSKDCMENYLKKDTP